MRIKHNEHGYTLVIVLGVIVLFTIMGLSLITLNMSGTTKNASRENMTQAQDLSVKGIDYVVKDIEHKVNTLAQQSGGFSPQEFEVQFKAILDSYLCSTIIAPNLPNSQTGDALFCIENYKQYSSEFPHLKEVNFKSTGQSDSKQYVTKATYLLGSSINSNFEYALLTYGNSNTSATNTIGNIELHGGLQVNGNIHAHNTLITSNTSKYRNTIVPSVLPTIKGTTEATLPPRVEQQLLPTSQQTSVGPVNSAIQTKLTEINDPDFSLQFNQYNSDSFFNPIEVNSAITIDFNIVNRINSMREHFFVQDADNDPSNDKFKNDVTPIQTGYVGSSYITGIGKYSNYALMSESEVVKGKTRYYGARVRNLNTSATKSYPRGYRVVTESIDVLDTEITDPDKFNWEVYGENNLSNSNVAFPMELRLSYGVEGADTNPNLKVNNAYVEKNMIIGLNNKNETNFGLFDNLIDLDALGLLSGLEKVINVDTPVHIEGTYYINGDLIISSARVTGDATFFVKGKTTILFSDLGVKRDEKQADSKFNILSHGPVRIAYVGNNHNSDEKYEKHLKDLKKFIDDVHTSEWFGHIHSDDQVIIDGATSNMTLNGSISSKKIVATSIKGRTQPSCRDVGYYTRTYVVDGVLVPTLSALLSDKITKELINALLGKEDDGAAFNFVLDKDTTGSVVKYNSNCFEKVKGQNAEAVKPPAYLIKALGIQLIGIGSDYHKITPRLTINHNANAINELKSKFNITYNGSPKITKLDSPQELSRQ